MKTIVIISAFLFISLTSLAQKPDQVLARITYNFTHVRDTNQRANPYTENMLLVIGKNASVYTSLTKIERDLDMAKARRSPGAPFKPITNVDYYFFAAEHKFITRERFMNSYYLIDEPSEKINWKITKDTASFAGIHCKKATTHFKGRNWIAWYAPELPFQSGPWKLNSLPGLIIEAYDENRDVQFQLAKIDNLKKENLTSEQEVEAKQYEKSNFFSQQIILQTDAKKTTRAEFDKVYEVYKKDPIGFTSAESGIPRNRVFVGSSSTGVSHNIINNPIELPEKQPK